MILHACLFWLALAGAALANPDAWRVEWPDTDFSRSHVPDWSEIISGGPGKDGIPALSDPDFIPAAQEQRIAGREPVITVEIGNATPRGRFFTMVRTRPTASIRCRAWYASANGPGRWNG